MAKAKKKTDKRSDRMLAILLSVLAVAVIVMVVALNIPKTTQWGEFVRPDFDPSAQSGVPETDEALGYDMLYQEGMAYRISICGIQTGGILTMDEDRLIVFFTNHAENEKYLKLRVLDNKGNILGETGLLKPGEYVQAVTLSEQLASGSAVKLKVMGYEPEDYTSAGSIVINMQVG